MKSWRYVCVCSRLCRSQCFFHAYIVLIVMLLPRALINQPAPDATKSTSSCTSLSRRSCHFIIFVLIQCRNTQHRHNRKPFSPPYKPPPLKTHTTLVRITNPLPPTPAPAEPPSAWPPPPHPRPHPATQTAPMPHPPVASSHYSSHWMTHCCLCAPPRALSRGCVLVGFSAAGPFG